MDFVYPTRVADGCYVQREGYILDSPAVVESPTGGSVVQISVPLRQQWLDVRSEVGGEAIDCCARMCFPRPSTLEVPEKIRPDLSRSGEPRKKQADCGPSALHALQYCAGCI